MRCNYFWTSNEGKIGSNHGCGLDHGHIGAHECAECDAEKEAELPHYTTLKYVVLIGDGFPS